jgi:aminopeptidase
MYTPTKQILEKYAAVLINFALNSGTGIKPKEVVFLQVPECAKLILEPLRNAVLKSQAYPIIQYLPDDVTRGFFEHATDDQLAFFPEKYLRGKVEQADHFLMIIAETNLRELEGIDPAKIMLQQKSMKKYKQWRDEKENAGKMTWTLGLYGTPAMAKEAKLTLKEYWKQIIAACFLDATDPIAKWRQVTKEIDRVKKALNDLAIEKLHVVAKNTDLWVGLGKNRKWLGGSGRNIPSFELFISPDWRKTEGHIYFNEPLYRYGSLAQEIHLEFHGGKVVNVSAKKGEAILKQMIATENADKIGEFSLTDCRTSRITKFMAETLFDENMGGKFGNTHMALGSAYKDSFTGNPAEISEEKWREMGYNESVVHTDIVQTIDRTVTATLPNGKEKVIYKDGKFTV